MDKIWSQAKALIAQGKLTQALALLCQHLGADPQAETDLIVLQARLSQLKRAEMLFGSNPPTDMNQLTKSVLDFITELEKNASPPVAKSLDFVTQMRSNSLQQKIKEGYALMEQWEQKQSLSDSPTETKRCEVEIQRLQGILDKYLIEWGQLNR